MSDFAKTDKTKLRRNPKRGAYDKESVYEILDAGFMAHIAYIIDGSPFVTPTLYWREGDYVYWHGSSKSRMLMQQSGGIEVCLNVALFDGFVLARSPFHHSANYRSVSIYGKAEEVTDKAHKIKSLDIMMEHFFPGRLAEVRGHLDKEIKATKLLRLPIKEAVAKVREGLPVDDDEDYDEVACWAGVWPAELHFATPYDDGRLKPGVKVPNYMKKTKWR